jgi:hypothetical protein
VFFRLGTRNIWRRRSRTLLIVIGLMLGTALISAALNTGDTLSHSIRMSAVRQLGNTDELVGFKGVSADQFGVFTVVDYFDYGTMDEIRAAADASGRVDGVAPAIIETIAVQDTTTRQTESQIGLFATDNYPEIQSLFESRLPCETATFKEYHALLVEHAKATCRPRPRCGACVLRDLCDFGGSRKP